MLLEVTSVVMLTCLHFGDHRACERRSPLTLPSGVVILDLTSVDRRQDLPSYQHT